CATASVETPCRSVARTVIVQVAGAAGAVHCALKNDVLSGSGRRPTQSSVMVVDPGWPSAQPTLPNSERGAFTGAGPQSTGMLGVVRKQLLLMFRPICGGCAVAGVPGRTSTAAVTLVARPSPLTARAVRMQTRPVTGGSQNPNESLGSRDDRPK